MASLLSGSQVESHPKAFDFEIFDSDSESEGQQGKDKKRKKVHDCFAENCIEETTGLASTDERTIVISLPTCEEHHSLGNSLLHLLAAEIEGFHAQTRLPFFKRWNPDNLRQEEIPPDMEHRYLRARLESLQLITDLCQYLLDQDLDDRKTERRIWEIKIAATNHRSACQALHCRLAEWDPADPWVAKI